MFQVPGRKKGSKVSRDIDGCVGTSAFDHSAAHWQHLFEFSPEQAMKNEKSKRKCYGIFGRHKPYLRYCQV